MRNFLIKIFGREQLKHLYFKTEVLLNVKNRRSFRDVEKKFHKINDAQKEELYKYLSEFYFVDDEHLNSDIGKKDMEDHLINRLFNFRYRTIPWINSLITSASIWDHLKVLEIGCGTGSATVALAEQGCELTSIDVNNIHIEAARKRCELYGLSANILALNATDITSLNNKFDLIIFSASLEHMTYEERIISIKSAWNMLKKNGFLIVLEAPNRLFHFDSHSSMLPFYHWLPDQIAMRYSKFSPRESCINTGYDENKFIRFGRGVSFHEFEIALDTRCSNLVIYNMQSFAKTFISNIVSNKYNYSEYKYNNFLKKIGPKNIPDGFYYCYLYIAIKKP